MCWKIRPDRRKKVPCQQTVYLSKFELPRIEKKIFHLLISLSRRTLSTHVEDKHNCSLLHKHISSITWWNQNARIVMQYPEKNMNKAWCSQRKKKTATTIKSWTKRQKIGIHAVVLQSHYERTMTPVSEHKNHTLHTTDKPS